MLKFIQTTVKSRALLAGGCCCLYSPGFLDRQYLSVQTLTMVYSSAQILILLAMGATLVMLTRNIDVSVGSITGMCAVLLGDVTERRIFTTCCLCRDFTAWFARGDFLQRCPGRVAKDPCHCCHPWHVRVVQRHHVAVDWRQMD